MKKALPLFLICILILSGCRSAKTSEDVQTANSLQSSSQTVERITADTEETLDGHYEKRSNADDDSSLESVADEKQTATTTLTVSEIVTTTNDFAQPVTEKHDITPQKATTITSTLPNSETTLRLTTTSPRQTTTTTHKATTVTTTKPKTETTPISTTTSASFTTTTAITTKPEATQSSTNQTNGGEVDEGGVY